MTTTKAIHRNKRPITPEVGTASKAEARKATRAASIPGITSQSAGGAPTAKKKPAPVVKEIVPKQRPRELKPKATGAPPKPSSSKQEAVITMLRAPAGSTIAAMMKATGWQSHSVRGFLAGVVRKKLGLKLTSDKIDGERIYRIPVNKSPGPLSTPRKASRPTA